MEGSNRLDWDANGSSGEKALEGRGFSPESRTKNRLGTAPAARGRRHLDLRPLGQAAILAILWTRPVKALGSDKTSAPEPLGRWKRRRPAPAQPDPAAASIGVVAALSELHRRYQHVPWYWGGAARCQARASAASLPRNGFAMLNRTAFCARTLMRTLLPLTRRTTVFV
jgi:hypothetical protein